MDIMGKIRQKQLNQNKKVQSLMRNQGQLIDGSQGETGGSNTQLVGQNNIPKTMKVDDLVLNQSTSSEEEIQQKKVQQVKKIQRKKTPVYSQRMLLNQQVNNNQNFYPEICSIYQSEAERELNRPRRKAIPNPALEADMDRYRQKIEARFQASQMNQNFKFPKFFPMPEREPRASSQRSNDRQVQQKLSLFSPTAFVPAFSTKISIQNYTQQKIINSQRSESSQAIRISQQQPVQYTQILDDYNSHTQQRGPKNSSQLSMRQDYSSLNQKLSEMVKQPPIKKTLNITTVKNVKHSYDSHVNTQSLQGIKQIFDNSYVVQSGSTKNVSRAQKLAEKASSVQSIKKPNVTQVYAQPQKVKPMIISSIQDSRPNSKSNSRTRIEVKKMLKVQQILTSQRNDPKPVAITDTSTRAKSTMRGDVRQNANKFRKFQLPQLQSQSSNRK